MSGRFWKEAATLIIVGRSAYPKGQVKLLQDADYNLLFLKRSQKSSFMPSAFVFPGGMTETSDFSLDWLDVFKKCGYTVDDLIKEFRSGAPVPEFYTNKPPDALLPEIGFRITAIRETFEECGMLMASKMSSDAHNEIDLKKWSKAVHKDASQFLKLFREFGGCPAIWDLHEWSGWLTPGGMPKRFDTVFFITFIDEIQNATADRKEIADLQIASPRHILEQWHDGSLWLPPPQTYEMSRFLQFRLYDKLKAFASSRSKKGLERFCPFRVNANDGVLSVLPGDDLYPKDEEKAVIAEPITIESSMEELRNSAKHLHRMEFTSMKYMNFVGNITPKYGHILPVNFGNMDESSKL